MILRKKCTVGFLTIIALVVLFIHGPIPRLLFSHRCKVCPIDDYDQLFQTNKLLQQMQLKHNIKKSRDQTIEKLSTKLTRKSIKRYITTPSYQTTKLPSLKNIVRCHDKDTRHRFLQRSNYWVLSNYITAQRRFHCWESITITTHTDYIFLDNLQPLLLRWQGPVSLALYAPGTDFAPTLQSVRWARNCMTNLVAELVTFHIYFDFNHVPAHVPPSSEALSGPTPNCSAPPPWTNVSSEDRYKTKNHLLYPINVGRNIARENAETYYVFPSDIELYPSPGVINDFFEMIRRNDPPLRRPAPKVFPLAVFELVEGSSLPETKSDLVKMLKNKTAIPFHKYRCSICHTIPKSEEWIQKEETNGLSVFHIEKRTGDYRFWEPFYIGTNDDPIFDERLTWEGMSDKMTQGYAMCVLGYEFHILDNSFLVHKPGIKRELEAGRMPEGYKTKEFIDNHIRPEMEILFGNDTECVV